jgi:hypothetical protein
MRLLLIGCGLLLRELSDAIVRSPHLIDAKFLPAGLHDTGAKSMRQRLQQEIDATNISDYDASAGHPAGSSSRPRLHHSADGQPRKI